MHQAAFMGKMISGVVDVLCRKKWKSCAEHCFITRTVFSACVDCGFVIQFPKEHKDAYSMSRADEIYRATCLDILENGFWDTDLDVRPKSADGTPAHTVKKFGVVNRYDQREEFA